MKNIEKKRKMLIQCSIKNKYQYFKIMIIFFLISHKNKPTGKKNETNFL
jgi:hypothetical protein